MAQTLKRRKRESPSQALVALAGGGLLSLALAAGLLMLLSAALCTGRLEEPSALRLCPAAVGLGSLGGGIFAARRLGERFLPAALGAAALGALLWALLGALALDGVTPAGAAKLLLPALVGGTLAGVLSAR